MNLRKYRSAWAGTASRSGPQVVGPKESRRLDSSSANRARASASPLQRATASAVPARTAKLMTGKLRLASKSLPEKAHSTIWPAPYPRT